MVQGLWSRATNCCVRPGRLCTEPPQAWGAFVKSGRAALSLFLLGRIFLDIGPGESKAKGPRGVTSQKIRAAIGFVFFFRPCRRISLLRSDSWCHQSSWQLSDIARAYQNPHKKVHTMALEMGLSARISARGRWTATGIPASLKVSGNGNSGLQARSAEWQRPTRARADSGNLAGLQSAAVQGAGRRTTPLQLAIHSR